MMNSKKLVLVLLLAFSISAYPCLNVYHALDAQGEFHSLGHSGFIGFNKNFNLPRISKKLPGLEESIREEKSPYLLSDYAVLLMKAGKVEESLRILITLNKNLPKEYKIAANLGTAYELNGNLDSALHYIKRGMELNPDAHEGSEWVHIRILETKMGLEKDSSLLSKRSVLQLSESDIKSNEIREQLEIQIRERFPFSPGPNAIMASLMIDLADCYAETFSFEYAKAFYIIAQEYYGADEAITKPNINKMISLRQEHDATYPPDVTSEGMDIKVQGVRYKDIIDDNNKDNYEINWSEFNIDVPNLLSLVEFEEYLIEEIEIPEPEKDTINGNTGDKEEPTPVEKSNYLIPLTIGFVVLLLIGIGIRKRKKS